MYSKYLQNLKKKKILNSSFFFLINMQIFFNTDAWNVAMNRILNLLLSEKS